MGGTDSGWSVSSEEMSSYCVIESVIDSTWISSSAVPTIGVGSIVSSSFVDNSNSS